MKFTSLLLLIAVLAAPIRAEEPPKAEPKVADLKKGALFTGRTEATLVQIRPRVTSYVTKILVREGELVRKGDVLVEVDDRAFKAKLTVAQAELTIAQAQEKTAATEYVRTKEAFAKGVAGKGDVEKAEASLTEAKARTEASKAAMLVTEINLAYTKMVAPIDGRVTRFSVTEGDLVTADKTRITEVIADNPISVVFDVDENTALAINRALKDGGKLAVEVGAGNEEGYPHKGEANAKALVVDPKKGTVQFRATLENPKGLLLHGQYVRVKLTVQPK